MTVTVPQLGARVLRRLGLAVTAVASRGAPGAVVSVGAVADRALRSYGVLVNESERPQQGVPLSNAQIGASVLQRLGFNPTATAPFDLGAMTVTEIAVRALTRLEVIAADETPAGQDLVLAVRQAQAVHATMQAEGVVPFGEAAIPKYVGELYAMMTAFMLASSYGRPVDVAAWEWARKELRTLVISGPHGLDIAMLEVRAVNATLAERGLAWWPDDAVPPSAAAEVVILAAARLAPVYGQPMDPAAVEGAEARISRMAMVRGARQRAIDAVTGAYAELSAAGLAPWGLDAIPAGAAEAMEALAVQAVAGDFGKASDPAAMDAAYQRLRRQLFSGPAGQAIAEEHIWGVHADLDARGRVRWSLRDIPDQAEWPMVLLAAYRMAPEVGVQPNPADVVQAEMAISRITALPSSGERVRAEYY